jgi:uncharacterized membrane protein
MTGYLLLVPEEGVTYLDMTPEEAIKMLVSAGALVPPSAAKPARSEMTGSGPAAGGSGRS